MCANQIESFDSCCPRTPKLKGCDVDGPFVSIRPRKAQESHPPNRPLDAPRDLLDFEVPIGLDRGSAAPKNTETNSSTSDDRGQPDQMATPTPHGAACARAFRRPVPAPAVLGALLSPFPSCPSRSWCGLGRSGTWRRGRIIRIITHQKKCSNKQAYPCHPCTPTQQTHVPTALVHRQGRLRQSWRPSSLHR